MRLIHTSYKLLIIIFLTVISVVGAHAEGEGKQNRKEKIEAMRIAYLTKRLDLSPEEAKIFWPVYDKYRKELSALRQSYFPKDDGSDPHLDADRQLEFEQKKLDLKKKYKPEFEQVLGKEKLNKLVGAEEDFKHMLLQTIRNQHHHGGGMRK